MEAFYFLVILPHYRTLHTFCQEQPDTPQSFFWVETKIWKINWPPSGTERDEHLK